MLYRLVFSDALFQSTPPARGATPCRVNPNTNTKGISIHAPREGGDHHCAYYIKNLGISIHAPREGGDFIIAKAIIVHQRFQSTPPARGATALTTFPLSTAKAFQSTPPARGGDSTERKSSSKIQYFNPRPPRGGRQYVV